MDDIPLLNPLDFVDCEDPPIRPFKLNTRDRVAVERHLLGLMMEYPEYSHIVTSQLDPDHFARNSSSLIFAAMLDLASDGVPTTLREVGRRLDERGEREAVGHKYFLVDIAYNAGIPPVEISFRGAVEIKYLTNLVMDHARLADERRQEGRTALYRWYDPADCLLYVGITDRLAQRTRQHGLESIWTLFASSSTIERFPSRKEALAWERRAIKLDNPIFNWIGNDSPEVRDRMVWYLNDVRRPDLIPYLPGASDDHARN